MLITIPNPGTISFDFGSSVLTSGVDVVELEVADAAGEAADGAARPGRHRQEVLRRERRGIGRVHQRAHRVGDRARVVPCAPDVARPRSGRPTRRPA